MPWRRRLRWVSGQARIARERRLTVLAAALALGGALPVVHDSIALALDRAHSGAYLQMLADVALIGLAALLAYGTVTYFLARLGHLARLRTATVAGTADAIAAHDPLDRSSLVALIPSYHEDAEVVLRAVTSAALQPHPDRRVVLLIDDAPEEAGSSIDAVRAIPAYVARLLRPMRERCERALRDFEARAAAGGLRLPSEAAHAADLCEHAAAWFETQAAHHREAGAAASFFGEVTFGAPAARWRREARRWRRVAAGWSAPVSIDDLRRLHEYLLGVFRVEVTSFERKRFVNLSHAPNKAMNINTYLGLLGGSYREEARSAGPVLSPCAAADADLIVPDADYALILDADTIVSTDYVGKLLPRFRAGGGDRYAVVQSPYSTFPGDRGVLQRIAGAQTDVQYLVHQGLTHYDATYWVGANALVRVAALRELAVKDAERGFEIVKFICDRTLIEDTESTIELVSRGWRLYNHPERLAFSMTPPDFGSLLIQRQRWANGGLLVVPKLLAYLWRLRSLRARVREGFMRLHYLISLGPVSMALLVALGVSWDKQLRTGGLLLTGLVYYAIYARDLHLLGYRWYDVFRVVALNIVLIPVNLVGMMSSVVQAITGRRSRFGRTPKVQDRTRVPARYVVAEFALLGLWCAHAVVSLLSGALVVTVFMFGHAVFAAYAIAAFMGLGNSAADLTAAMRAPAAVTARRARAPAPAWRRAADLSAPAASSRRSR
jgi:cellulose synthase/poly-beta-1,6-N-acetylglucosamine synthase-like glycosyltransferase